MARTLAGLVECVVEALGDHGWDRVAPQVSEGCDAAFPSNEGVVRSKHDGLEASKPLDALREPGDVPEILA